MESMKFYRSIRHILDKYAFLTILLFIVFPTVFYFPLKAVMVANIGALVLVVLLLIITCIGVGFYYLYYLLIHLANIRKVMFEIAEEGVLYPYLLQQSRLILWEEIKNIQLKRYSKSGYYVVIELKETVKNIGELNRYLGFSMNGYFQKSAKGRGLVVPQEAIDY